MPMERPSGFAGWADHAQIPRAVRHVMQGRLEIDELPRSVREQVKLRVAALKREAEKAEEAAKPKAKPKTKAKPK